MSGLHKGGSRRVCAPIPLIVAVGSGLSAAFACARNTEKLAGRMTETGARAPIAATREVEAAALFDAVVRDQGIPISWCTIRTPGRVDRSLISRRASLGGRSTSARLQASWQSSRRWPALSRRGSVPAVAGWSESRLTMDMVCRRRRRRQLIEDLIRENNARSGHRQAGRVQGLGRPGVAGVVERIGSGGGKEDTLRIRAG